MHCVAGVWQTGHSGSCDWQICPAQSMQKRLWPHGTSAAVTSLSQHTKQSRGTIPARPPALRHPNIVVTIPTPLPPPSESVGEPPGSEDAEQDEYPVLLPPLLLLPAENELPVPVWSQESVLSGSLCARRASGWSGSGERRGVTATPFGPLLLRRTVCAGCFAPFANGAQIFAALNSKPKSSDVAGKFGVESPAKEKLPPALLVLNGLVGLPPPSVARRVAENDSDDILRDEWCTCGGGAEWVARDQSAPAKPSDPRPSKLTSVPLQWKSLSPWRSTKAPVRRVMCVSISSRARSTFSGMPVTSNTGSFSRLGVTI